MIKCVKFSDVSHLFSILYPCINTITQINKVISKCNNRKIIEIS